MTFVIAGSVLLVALLREILLDDPRTKARQRDRKVL
jgi:hypothetical protein